MNVHFLSAGGHNENPCRSHQRDNCSGRNINTHRIELEGDFGHAVLEIASNPSAVNPASSDIAAYSVLAKLKNLAEDISFI
jgi:predicted dinucleotide-utilizing enzyme